VALCAFSKTTQAQPQAADIGGITELRGNARVVRQDPIDAELELGIQQNDNVQTANGRLGITFLDDSVVRLTENSSLVITEYVFNPDPEQSRLGLNFASGTARFVTGGLNRIAKQNISISTPSASVAINGTDFTVTNDELGSSLIILLPDENGNASGEIVVTTGAGTVTLNEEYMATVTTMFEQPPTEPVILDITLDLIDNLLIVSPPEEVREDETVGASNVDALNIDFLEFNELDFDALAENNLEFSELDIDYLDVNFFEDALALLAEEDLLKDTQLNQQVGTNLEGTELGQDLNTQIVTILSGDNLNLQRSVQHGLNINTSASQSTRVNITQDGIQNVVKVNGGNDNIITVSQGS